MRTLRQQLIIALTTVMLPTVILGSQTLHAQFDNNFGQLSQDNGTNMDTGDPTGNSNGLNADDAFSAIEVGTEIGKTENTGRGFSSASVAPPTSSANGQAGNVTPGGIGGGIGGFGGVGGFGRLFDNVNSGSSQSTPPVIRTRLRSAVQVQPRSPIQVQQTASNRFQYLSNRPQLRRVNVSMQGRTAVLQGTVSSDSVRRMSHLLMRLEPGISRVENRLIVQP